MSWILFALAVALYLTPVGIAANRRHRNMMPILLVNVLLGWTVVGWLAALIWSTTSNIEGPPAAAQVRCRACAEMISAQAKVCKHCHAAVSGPPTGMRPCPACQRDAVIAAKFCPGCGANMTRRT